MMRHAPIASGAIFGIAMLGVASPSGAQQPLPTWPVDPTPIVSIGREGVTSEEFADVRGAFLLSGGRIAVGNGNPVGIRLFDASGHYLRSFGRQGAGPAEFRRLGWLGHAGDTVFVFDFGLRRITIAVFDREPRLLNTLRVTATGDRDMFDVAGRLDDGHWLVRTQTSPRFDIPPGVHRLRASVGTIAPDAVGKVSWLGEFPGLAVFVNSPTGRIEDAAVGVSAFSPSFLSAAAGATVWLGDTAGDSLAAFGANGQHRLTTHLPFPRRPLQSPLADAMRSAELNVAPDEQAKSITRVKYASDHLPHYLPFFQALVPGPGGEVWVQEYTVKRTDPARYVVVGSDGAPRAWVTLPAGVCVSDVAKDRLVGIHVDDDGVETIEVLRYMRN